MNINRQKADFLRSNDTGHADALVLLVHCKKLDLINLMCDKLEEAGMRYRTAWLEFGDYQWVWRSRKKDIPLPVVVKLYKTGDFDKGLNKKLNAHSDEYCLEWLQRFTSLGIPTAVHYVVQGQRKGSNLNSFMKQDGNVNTEINIHQTGSVKETAHLLTAMSAEIGLRIFRGEFHELRNAYFAKMKMIVNLPERNWADIPTNSLHSTGAEQKAIHQNQLYTCTTDTHSTSMCSAGSHSTSLDQSVDNHPSNTKQSNIRLRDMQSIQSDSDDSVILLDYENTRKVERKSPPFKDVNKNERNVCKRLAILHRLPDKSSSPSKKHITGRVYLMKNVPKTKLQHGQKKTSRKGDKVLNKMVVSKSDKSQSLVTTFPQLTKGHNPCLDNDDDDLPDLTQDVPFIESEISHHDMPPELIKMEDHACDDPELPMDLDWDFCLNSGGPLSQFWSLEQEPQTLDVCAGDFPCDKNLYIGFEGNASNNNNNKTEIFCSDSPIKDTRSDNISHTDFPVVKHDNDSETQMSDNQIYHGSNETDMNNTQTYHTDSPVGNTESCLNDTQLNHNDIEVPEYDTTIYHDGADSPVTKADNWISVTQLNNNNNNTLKKDAQMYPVETNSLIGTSDNWISDTQSDPNVIRAPQDVTHMPEDTRDSNDQHRDNILKEKLDIVLTVLPNYNQDAIRKMLLRCDGDVYECVNCLLQTPCEQF